MLADTSDVITFQAPERSWDACDVITLQAPECLWGTSDVITGSVDISWGL